MNHLGFLLNTVGENQLSYHLIKSANAYLSSRDDTDIIAFYQNVGRTPHTPLFALMNLSEAYDYHGVAVATSLETARYLLKFPGPLRRYYYICDCEWLRNRWSYEQMVAVFGNPKIELIARCHDHARLVEDCWNRPAGAVIADCDVGDFVREVYKHGR